jgi:acyl-homoserine-lactone acylase
MMARNYLRARGEEAAHFGEAFAAGDFLTRRVRIHETTREAFPKLPPWVRRNLDAYALGYTRYVAKHRDQLPEWVPRATGVGVLASSRHALILNFSTDPAVRRRFHDLGVRAPTGPAAGKAQGISSTDDPYRPSHAIGSNMWAIHKDRSASGKALLLGNPHLDWSGDVLHEAHLTVPGRLNVMGATLVGTPGLTIGFNDTLGWSLTVNAHDSDDLYELKLSGDGTSYLYDGRPLPLHRDELTIQVKTKAGLEPRTLEALRSHYGPTVKTQGVRASRGSRRISTSAATSNRCS